MITRGWDNKYEENCLYRHTIKIFQNIFPENLKAVLKSPSTSKSGKHFLRL